MPKISALPPIAEIAGDETVVLVKSGFTRRGGIGGLVGAAVAPHVEAAQLAAATAMAASNFFGTGQFGSEAAAIAAGELATPPGALFSVDDGSGALIYLERTAEGSVEVARAVTPSALAGAGGAGAIGWSLEGLGAIPRNLAERLREGLTGSVRDFDLMAGSGGDDTDAFVLAFENREAMGRPLNIGDGAFQIGSVTRTSGISFNGSGPQRSRLIATPGLEAPLLNLTYATSLFNANIGSLALDMGEEDQTAVHVNDVHRTVFENWEITGGSTGFYLGAGGDCRLDRMFLLNQKNIGLEINGDIGSEQYVIRSLIRVTDPDIEQESALKLRRETTADTGGFYFLQPRITRGGGIINNGFDFRAENPNTLLFAFLIGAVADNINGNGAALRMKNVSDIMSIGGFFRGSANLGAIAAETSRDVSAISSDVDNGPLGKCVNFIGVNTRFSSFLNKYNQGTVFHYTDGASSPGLSFLDIVNSFANLTNSAAALLASFTEYRTASPMRFITAPGGGKQSTVSLWDLASNKQIHLRCSNGVLQILNDDFSLITECRFNGDIAGGDFVFVNQGIAVGGVKVVGAQVTGCPPAATDLASAITLVNFLRSAGLSGGAIAT